LASYYKVLLACRSAVERNSVIPTLTAKHYERALLAIQRGDASLRWDDPLPITKGSATATPPEPLADVAVTWFRKRQHDFPKVCLSFWRRLSLAFVPTLAWGLSLVLVSIASGGNQTICVDVRGASRYEPMGATATTISLMTSSRCILHVLTR